MTIPELIEKLEKATGPDRGLDGRIAWALGWRFNGFMWNGDQIGGPDTVEDFDDWHNVGGSWHQPGDRFISIDETWDTAAVERWPNPPEWTASVDAALDLMTDHLSGWYVENLCQWEATVLRERGEWMCDLVSPQKVGEGRVHSKCPHAPTPAIALCIAILRALQPKEGE